MIHVATRRLFKSGRSVAVTVPRYAADRLNLKGGETFVVVFDDERSTLTFQRIFDGTKGPRVEIDGRQVESVMMP